MNYAWCTLNTRQGVEQRLSIGLHCSMVRSYMHVTGAAAGFVFCYSVYNPAAEFQSEAQLLNTL
jgi:hypothetical protein